MSVAIIKNLTGGGKSLEDINPNRENILPFVTCNASASSSNTGAYGTLPINGYKKISLKFTYTTYCYARFLDETGTTISSLTLPAANTWGEYVNIPDNAKYLSLFMQCRSNATNYIYGSLLTK